MIENSLIEEFYQTRKFSLELIKNLPIEDLCVQPASFVSPIKWHLGHTTWIFEKTIQQRTKTNSFNPKYDLVFNSYYKGLGLHWDQQQRGHLSRPTVTEILDYRQKINQQVQDVYQEGILPSDQLKLAIEHEKQHQELIVMDLKYILSLGIGLVEEGQNYEAFSPKRIENKNHYTELKKGIYEIGASNKASFCFDNELPKHEELIGSVEIENSLVTNGDYLEFVESEAYNQSHIWLSDGWDWKQKYHIQGPLYWFREKNVFFENFFGVKKELDLDAPVSHISYYEADAYARFKGLRLPSEFELELFFMKSNPSDLWVWTNSSYHPYPGFKPFEGFAKEYNGKFMSGQMTLRGGSIITPKGHYRPTYRNFYRPTDRWQYSGIKLAKDLL